MKKISFWAACIAVIMLLFSCSKEPDQFFSPLSSHSSGVRVTTTKNDRKAIDGFQYQQDVNTNVDENASAKFGGGEDDDKPIIMHFVRNIHDEPVENALILMVNSVDSLRVLTNSAGESSLELPRVGVWQLKVTHEGYSPLITQVTVTDSLSVKTSTLEDQ